MASKTLTDKRYLGKVCATHPEWEGLRLKSNTTCVQCRAEKGETARKAWSKNNPEKVALSHKINYENNKAARLSAGKKWRGENPSLITAKAAKYRSSKLDRTPPWADLEKIKEIYRLAAELGMTVDHVVPLQGELVSGLHVHINLQLLCGRENSAKGNKFHG